MERNKTKVKTTHFQYSKDPFFDENQADTAETTTLKQYMVANRGSADEVLEMLDNYLQNITVIPPIDSLVEFEGD